MNVDSTNMKKKLEMKNDGHEYERFEDALRKIVKVSKKEYDEREKAEKEKKAIKTDSATK